MKKIKITELPLAISIDGLSTIAVDNYNQSKRILLETIENNILNTFVELTAEEIAALLPADESQIATLELDAEDDVAGADKPSTCEALERFRTHLREMRGRSVFKPKEVYNPNDYINYEHE